MGIIIGIVAIGFLFITGIVAFSLFGSAFTDIQRQLDERVELQNEQVNPNVRQIGNLAKDTGTRVCNLKVTFVGSAQGNLFNNDLDLFHGKFVGLFSDVDISLSGITPRHDDSIAIYKWFCQDPGPEQASFLDILSFHSDANLLNLASNDIFQTQQAIQLRMHFDGTSLTNGKRLVGSQEPDGIVNLLEFSGSQRIALNTPLPLAYSIPVFLYDVTEDNYDIEFFSKQYKMNDKPVLSKFIYTICKPGLSSC